MARYEKILLPTAYFPPVSYMYYMSGSQGICIEQMETYPKQTYRNRCEIMTSAGKLDLVVPVMRPNGNHTMTRDIAICYREPWQQHHWKSIQAAYRSSPYFNYYADLLQPLFEERERSLISMNNKILSVINKITGITPCIEFTQDYVKHPDDLIDLRFQISPKRIKPAVTFPEYPQVFSHKLGFIRDLSVLDLIFNTGPDAKKYLVSLTVES